jgi:uncharacterized protein
MDKKFTFRSRIPRLSMQYPKFVLGSVLVLTLVFASMFPGIVIDTDPENSLPQDHEARVTNNEIKDAFFLYDVVAIAIEPSEDNITLTPDKLDLVYKLLDVIRKQDGVVEQDILGFYTTDDITGIHGGIHVDRLLRTPPGEPAQIEQLKVRLADHPVLDGLIFNETSGAIALLVPVENKSYSYTLRRAVESFWDEQPEESGKIHITGIPVAEESFGVEMFFQMATAAPLAFVFIGLLMLWFFRSFSLVFWSLMLSMISVIWTMGALIGLGFTVHIMSSMIPIFLLPIGVVDSIHVLSDFTDHFSKGKKSELVMAGVFEELFTPLFFTSLTTSIGFMSLSLTGIPPVRVFGVAVGLGIIVAFLLTITILPAGMRLWVPRPRKPATESNSLIGRLTELNGRVVKEWKGTVLILGFVFLALGAVGMSFIQLNDNPTRWFMEGHPIREADHYFNKEFAGSYPAYWVLQAEPGYWHEPENLAELTTVLHQLEENANVGKTTHIAELVGKIHRELHPAAVDDPLPATSTAVKQYLFLYENSGNPEDLYRLINQDGSEVNIWLHLRSGDNRDMLEVKELAGKLLASSTISGSVNGRWGGITHVNLIWQQVIVNEMVWALIAAYIAVFFVLLVLFRSLPWAIVGLIPLTVTMVFLYGAIGWIGKDYDMPLAVLSALSLGIAVDFAIHFIQRTRQFILKTGKGWPGIREAVAGEPARAISRNSVVIAVGFTPLLFSPLWPYVTVGLFMFLIMAVSGMATIIGMTAIMEQFQERLFPAAMQVPDLTDNKRIHQNGKNDRINRRMPYHAHSI